MGSVFKYFVRFLYGLIFAIHVKMKRMKVLLYFESERVISISGIGRARRHQIMACESAGIDYTLNPLDNYDILHINTTLLNSKSMVENARRHGRKVIYHAHSTEEDFRNSFMFSNQLAPFVKNHLISLYSSADEIITPTPYSKRLLEAYGIKVPITPISNGIDLNRFVYDENKIEAFLRYFSLNKDDKVVLGVGMLFERKGILDFFEVARALPDYTFIWFGTTPKISLPPNINKALEDPPLNVIMPGYVKGAIIEGAYLFSSCFFFPSYEETEGIVVLEALASRQQVIVRDIGAFEDWLVDGDSCYKGKNNDDFVELIDSYIKGDLRPTIDRGYEVAKKRSINAIGQELKKVYERVYQTL